MDGTSLLSHTASVHCLLPHCSIPVLGRLGHVSRQLNHLTQKELFFRAARLRHALGTMPIQARMQVHAGPEALPQAATVAPATPFHRHPIPDHATFKLLLRDLSRTGQPFTVTQRLALLTRLASEPGWLRTLDQQQRRQVLGLVLGALKEPDGIVSSTVQVVMALGQLETALLHLTPAQRASFWICLGEEASDTMPGRSPSATPENRAAPGRPLRDTLPLPQTHRQPPAMTATATAAVPPAPAPPIPQRGFSLQKLKHLLRH